MTHEAPSQSRSAPGVRHDARSARPRGLRRQRIRGVVEPTDHGRYDDVVWGRRDRRSIRTPADCRRIRVQDRPLVLDRDAGHLSHRSRQQRLDRPRARDRRSGRFREADRDDLARQLERPDGEAPAGNLRRLLSAARPQGPRHGHEADSLMIEKTLCGLAAVAILVTGAVHLELWLWHGYRGIPTVGTLFLLNAISAAVIAVGLLWRGGWLLE